MSTTKVTISIDENFLKAVDELVRRRVFANRNEAIKLAIEEKLSRLSKSRLANECSKLDRKFEKALAEHPENVEDV